MASFKVLLFTVLFALILSRVRVGANDASIADVNIEVDVPRSEGPDYAVLEELESKIRHLESRIEEKAREIRDKDELIAAKDNIIKQKSDSILLLENEIAPLKKKGNTDVAEQLGKAYARADELEKLAEKLRKDVDTKIKENKLLETRATKAETKVSELNSKFESLQKIIDEQKAKMHKTERALQIAEEEMMKAKYEAASKTKELMEAHGAWFPPWLAVHLIQYQSLLEKNWEIHGKPAYETLIQKASEKKAQAEEWAAPHVVTVKMKLVPAVKEQWTVITTKAEPHVKKLTTKTVEIYGVSKDAVTPHIIKIRELTYSYIQEIRKFSGPYIDQVATAARPHVGKLQTTFRPYTDKAVHSYSKFLKSATTYHHHIQGKVEEKLKSHDLTKHLATRELVWFAASAVLALPVLFLLRMCSAVIGKRTNRAVRNGNSNSSRRKGKRTHADK